MRVLCFESIVYIIVDVNVEASPDIIRDWFGETVVTGAESVGFGVEEGLAVGISVSGGSLADANDLADGSSRDYSVESEGEGEGERVPTYVGRGGRPL